MGTRSAVGAPLQESGTWRAVYVHWDGYPDNMVPVLLRLVNEVYAGDYEAAVRYLVDEHPQGWSSLNGSGRPNNVRDSHAQMAAAIDAGNPVPDRGDTDEHYAPDEGEAILTSAGAGIEWLYLLAAEGIRIFKVGGVGAFGYNSTEMRPLGHIAWDTDPKSVDWEKMSEDAYEQARTQQ